MEIYDGVAPSIDSTNKLQKPWRVEALFRTTIHGKALKLRCRLIHRMKYSFLKK